MSFETDSENGTAFEATNVESTQFIELPEIVVFKRGNLEILLTAFGWDDVRLAVDMARIDASEFGQWFDRWFDINEERVGSSELDGIIHWAQIEPGFLTVDFGSSETLALEELLDLIEKSGIDHVRLGRLANPRSTA